MLYEIKSWLDGSVLFGLETSSFKVCVEAAVKARVSLRYANMCDANMRYADMSGADMRYANMREADMSGAYMRGADMSGADMSYANMSGANMREADMSGAYMRGADMSGANMSYANMSGADMSGADMSVADMRGAKNIPEEFLRRVRDDFWAVLSSAPREVAGLRAAIVDGRINGSVYTGECACLVGTIANVRGCSYEQLGALKPDSGRLAETYFLGIKQGETPETNPMSKNVLDWLDEWVANMSDAFAAVREIAPMAMSAASVATNYAAEDTAAKTALNEAWTRINQSAVDLIRRISK